MRLDHRAEVTALVALLRYPGVRWSDVTVDVLTKGSALAVLRRVMNAEGARIYDEVALKAAMEKAAKLLDAWQADGIGVHSLFDDSYPAPLRDIHQMPPLVFTRGSLQNDRRSIAVVGTRTPTKAGVATATRIATALVENGVTVVSGLAQNIDTAAHTAALRAHGRTAAVIGTGVNRYYPPANRAFNRRSLSVAWS